MNTISNLALLTLGLQPLIATSSLNTVTAQYAQYQKPEKIETELYLVEQD